jgi:superfamily I DNA and/or RNA helicase
VHAVLQVLAYVQALRELLRNPVSASQIAVITLYRKQVQKIRTIFKGPWRRAGKQQFNQQ